MDDSKREKTASSSGKTGMKIGLFLTVHINSNYDWAGPDNPSISQSVILHIIDLAFNR